VTALSVVVLSWNTEELLRACLRSIYEGPRSIEFEVIVVDNASDDGSVEMVTSSYPEARLICNEKNEGYAKGNNIGMCASRGEYILLLNSDTEVREDAIEKMVGFLESNPEYGACSPKLINPDGTVQKACMRFPDLKVVFFFDTMLESMFPENRFVRRYLMNDFDHCHSRDVDQPPGACFMIRRELTESVGFLDEEMFLFYNDVDFCNRIWRAGLKIRYFEEARVMHHLGGSTRKYSDFGLELHKNKVLYYRKHYGKKGAGAAKAAAVLRGVEEIYKCLKAGCAWRSPEVIRIREVVSEVLGS